MRVSPKTYRAAGLAASSLLLIALGANVGLGDEPQPGSRLARLFRFGSSNSSPSQASGTHNHNHDDSAAPPTATGTPPTTVYSATTAPGTPPSTPNAPSSGAAPRITPQPRVSRPPTEADPIVTRIAVGRSDNGGQFGMFLQVFADGTVLDLEGVHRIGNDLMKPLMEGLRQGELYRLKGHCGAPSTDFIETTNVIVYERSYGKLRATSFSYSGNPQGCDPSVRKLHAALEAIQTRLSSPPSQGPATSAAAAPVLSGPAPKPPEVNPAPSVLGLTPAGN
jgi:hypothetical protein